jgi:hypothetical protein
VATLPDRDLRGARSIHPIHSSDPSDPVDPSGPMDPIHSVRTVRPIRSVSRLADAAKVRAVVRGMGFGPARHPLGKLRSPRATTAYHFIELPRARQRPQCPRNLKRGAGSRGRGDSAPKAIVQLPVSVEIASVFCTEVQCWDQHRVSMN